MLSFLGKLPWLTARLALVLAFLDWATEGGEEPREITVQHFGRAAHRHGASVEVAQMSGSLAWGALATVQAAAGADRGRPLGHDKNPHATVHVAAEGKSALGSAPTLVLMDERHHWSAARGGQWAYLPAYFIGLPRNARGIIGGICPTY